MDNTPALDSLEQGNIVGVRFGADIQLTNGTYTLTDTSSPYATRFEITADQAYEKIIREYSREIATHTLSKVATAGISQKRNNEESSIVDAIKASTTLLNQSINAILNNTDFPASGYIGNIVQENFEELVSNLISNEIHPKLPEIKEKFVNYLKTGWEKALQKAYYQNVLPKDFENNYRPQFNQIWLKAQQES